MWRVPLLSLYVVRAAPAACIAICDVCFVLCAPPRCCACRTACGTWAGRTAFRRESSRPPSGRQQCPPRRLQIFVSGRLQRQNNVHVQPPSRSSLPGSEAFVTPKAAVLPTLPKCFSFVVTVRARNVTNAADTHTPAAYQYVRWWGREAETDAPRAHTCRFSDTSVRCVATDQAPTRTR